MTKQIEDMTAQEILSHTYRLQSSGDGQEITYVTMIEELVRMVDNLGEVVLEHWHHEAVGVYDPETDVYSLHDPTQWERRVLPLLLRANKLRSRDTSRQEVSHATRR